LAFLVLGFMLKGLNFFRTFPTGFRPAATSRTGAEIFNFYEGYSFHPLAFPGVPWLLRNSSWMPFWNVFLSPSFLRIGTLFYFSWCQQRLVVGVLFPTSPLFFFLFLYRTATFLLRSIFFHCALACPKYGYGLTLFCKFVLMLFPLPAPPEKSLVPSCIVPFFQSVLPLVGCGQQTFLLVH